MIALGAESATTSDLAGWVSTDGASWTRLDFSGSTMLPDGTDCAVMPDGTERCAVGGMIVADAWLHPSGVLVAGQGGLPQMFWVATAVHP